ncbi:MAG: type IX secretion system sortase PorU, partial [Cytophagales bacterium]|nr:type IX secretion system sortase PorU [Cytophagales bacterium]
MKLKVCLLVILFLVFSYKIQSQIPAENGSHPFGWSPVRGDIKIKWESNRYVKARKDGLKEVLAFEGGRYIDNDIPLPAYFLQFPGKYLSKFELYNETYQALDAASQKLVPANLVPAQLQISIDIQYQNRRPVSLVTFIPLRKNDLTGQFEKLVSFQYKFTESPPAKITNITRTYATNSVLADGDWYKLAIISSGIYKIDFNFLSNIGINPGIINPQNIKIFGNGGGMLPQANASFRVDDLEENAIYIEGENDGQFNANDYILFYAQGPHTWNYDSTNKIFTHTQNLYSDTAFYFLTVDITSGLRIQTQNSLTGGTPVNTFDDHFFHEQDLVNMGKSGRLWFGEVFDFTPQRDFNFDIPGLNNSEMKITSYVMGISSKSASSFSVNIAGQSLGKQSIPIQGGVGGDYPDWGEVKRDTFNINSSTFSNNSSITITLSYNKGSSGNAVGYLNYLEINAQRELKLYGNQTQFRSIESLNNAVSEFKIATVTSVDKIWEITDPLKPVEQSYTLNNDTANFSIATTTLRELIVFSGSAFPSPAYVGKIQNQNLHDFTAAIPHLVIVTSPVFWDQANKLADFRRSNDGLDVEVVTTNQVYNEFSSGAQDITAIRDFMKMLYDKGTQTDSIRYLLLFGDASYDYKNRVSPNTNFVPVYESNQSLVQIGTYSSDDYFGLLDDSEGNWGTSENSYLDIGVGRLPVKSIREAEDVVNKIINYSENKATFGKWRNKICFVADDGSDDNGSNIHVSPQAENLATKVINEHPVYNVNKIYLDAYPQIATPGGEKSPETNEAIDRNIENGVLIMNYTGHGGEAGWAHERILEVNQINNWENFDNLALFFTATCEFGRYDDPDRTSAGEYIILNPGGGAIAAITTTRPVYSGPNYNLNVDFYNVVFTPVNGEMPRLGDIIRKTKNEGPVLNDRNFSLLGDPSTRLAYPEKDVVVTKINSKDISPDSTVADTLKALSKITIKGEVRENKDDPLTKITDFNGF